MLLHFAQSQIYAPSLCSVTNICSLALLSCKFLLPRFAQSQIYAPSLCSVTNICSLALLSHKYMLSCFAQSQIYAPSLHSVANICSHASLSHFPFNGSIKLLQNLHSRGPMKQHFYVWETHCGYLHKVKRVNRAINMHSKGSNESLPKY